MKHQEVFMFFNSLETGIGYTIVLWFQSWRTSFVSSAFMPFNYLINEVTFLLVLPLIYWCIHKNAGKRLMQTLLFSFITNVWFKAFLARPRPYQVSVPGKPAVVPALPALDSYGIPSGHTQGSVVLFGFLAREVKKPVFTFLMVLLIILTGLSRLVHGVHYPQDVLFGALLGILVIFIYPPLYRTGSRFLSNFILPAQAVLSFLLFAGLIYLYKLFITDSGSYHSYISLAAVFSFGLFGFSLESRYIRFSTKGGLITRLLRFAAGIVLTFGIYIGLKLLFGLFTAAESSFPGLALRAVRYALLGLWISAGAPALFVRLGLAKRE